MAEQRPDSAPGAARRAAFFAVALLLPLLFFAAVEAGLRLSGQLREFPLFAAAPGNAAWLQANPEVVKRFFARPDAAPVVNIETAFFRAEKPADGLRIFVQGGSSAAGFPYGYGASLAGMLEQRLRRELVDRPIEVVSTAMSAVNSYTLLDFADEIIAQQPDAVLIYAGHNEYLGVQGVGSALSSGLSPGLTRLTQSLRGFATYQLVERALAGGEPDPDAAPPGGTLMARIAREKAIALDSPLYHKGIEQFRGNLSRLLERYRKAGVPVFIGTLVSNERDLPPFVSELASGTDRERWQSLFADGVVALEAGRFPDAERSLSEAIALDDGAADAWYASARLALRQGESEEARRRFVAAKDRDQLRFRAPDAFNTLIRDVGAEHGAVVVDTHGALAAQSDDGIIGNGLVLEHVHPNLDGYFLLADAFFDALGASGIVGDNFEPRVDEATARFQIPVSQVDRLFGEYKLQRVLNDWPFMPTARSAEPPAPTNAVENLAYQMYHRRIGWLQAMDQLGRYYAGQGNAIEQTRVALILADALPFGVEQQFAAGAALVRAERAPEALRYLERALERQPTHLNSLLALSHARVLTGDRAGARASLTRVLELDPDNATARNALARLQ
ncbi:MAG: tetratricopeptide repeat protein [Pseudomonadota bacterium]